MNIPWSLFNVPLRMKPLAWLYCTFALPEAKAAAVPDGKWCRILSKTTSTSTSGSALAKVDGAFQLERTAFVELEVVDNPALSLQMGT